MLTEAVLDAAPPAQGVRRWGAQQALSRVGVEPRVAQPRKVVPMRVERTMVEPTKVAQRRVDPRRVEPRQVWQKMVVRRLAAPKMVVLRGPQWLRAGVRREACGAYPQAAWLSGAGPCEDVLGQHLAKDWKILPISPKASREEQMTTICLYLYGFRLDLK